MSSNPDAFIAHLKNQAYLERVKRSDEEMKKIKEAVNTARQRVRRTKKPTQVPGVTIYGQTLWLLPDETS